MVADRLPLPSPVCLNRHAKVVIVLRTEPCRVISSHQAILLSEFRRPRFISEIIERVKTLPADLVPFRPEIPKESCPDQMISLMKKCWAENPHARPEINHITRELKILNGGRCAQSLPFIHSFLLSFIHSFLLSNGGRWNSVCFGGIVSRCSCCPAGHPPSIPQTPCSRKNHPLTLRPRKWPRPPLAGHPPPHPQLGHSRPGMTDDTTRTGDRTVVTLTER